MSACLKIRLRWEFPWTKTSSLRLRWSSFSAELFVADAGDRAQQEVVELPADGCPELRDAAAFS